VGVHALAGGAAAGVGGAEQGRRAKLTRMRGRVSLDRDYGDNSRYASKYRWFVGSISRSFALGLGLAFAMFGSR
jgi:hypothetical protein